MLKKYRNGFVDIIKEVGMSPAGFQASYDEPTFHIHLRNTKLNETMRFPIMGNEEDHHIFRYNYSTFTPKLEQIGYYDEWVRIDLIYGLFQSWLETDVTNYINELMTPDLWEQIEKEKPLVNGDKIAGAELTAFADEEKIQIRMSINEFKLAIITNFSPSEAEMRIIENRLNYLDQALDRLNRFDWRGVLLSSVVGITIALSLDTQKGRLLYELCKQAFTSALRYLQ